MNSLNRDKNVWKDEDMDNGFCLTHRRKHGFAHSDCRPNNDTTPTRGKKVKDYYKDLEIRIVLDTIFNGTMYSLKNMNKWLENFNKDRQKGNFK